MRNTPRPTAWLICTVVVVMSGCTRTSEDAPEAPGLGGTAWQLVRIEAGDGEVLQPDDPSKYTLTFNADGSVAARVDCNRGRGSWKSPTPGSIEFSQLALTRAMCPPESLHDRVVRDWPHIRTYVVRDGHLFLALMADGGTYEFEPLPGAAGGE